MSPQPPPTPDPVTPLPQAPSSRFDWPLVVVVLLAVISIPVWRAIKGQAKPEAKAGIVTPLPVPTVEVAKVCREDLYNEVTISAEFRPYLEVALHAKVAGYVEQMNVDIGDRVKAGQLLATLQAPDLVAELNNALAAQRRAEADYTNAFLLYQRLLAVSKEHPNLNLIAQQDLDTAQTKQLTAAAAIAAAKAAVEKYQTLVAYLKITAPFDGVVTRRYADPGALIQAGTASDTQSLPLVRISDNYRLRLDFDVSVKYVKDLHVGNPVEVVVQSLGGQRLTNTISRLTQKVEAETKTMTAEIDVPNPTLELVPGMYAIVVLKVERRPRVLDIPTECIGADQATNVYVVNRSYHIEDRTVVLGLETPTKREVISGLNEGELVVKGNRGRFQPGQQVEPKMIE